MALRKEVLQKANRRVTCICYALCAVWNRTEAYLPFFLAAFILLKNRDKNEALKILCEANKTLKASLLTDFIVDVRKNRWLKSNVAVGWDFYILDFGNCIQLALKEQSANTN
jgi:hypothetical protein